MEQAQLEQQRLEAQKQQELQKQREQQAQRQRDLEYQRQREIEMANLQEMERKRLEEERLRAFQAQAQAAHSNAQQEIVMYQTRLAETQNQLEQMNRQAMQDRQTIEQYASNLKSLEEQVALLASKNNDQVIQKLTEEVNVWKQKYEALAKLYAQLRKEHMDLLQQYKALKDAGSNVTEQSKAELEKLKAELKTKSNEFTELLVEKERYKNETDRLKAQYGEEMTLLRKELKDAQASLSDMSNSKGAEVSAMVSRFTAEKAQMESLLTVSI